MRVVTLPKDEKEARSLFGILNTAAFQGSAPKDHSQVRTLGKLQDVLEALTHKEEAEGESGSKVDVPVLNKGVKKITFEDAHLDLLKSRIFGADIGWLAGAARRITEAYDLLDSAETVTPDAKPNPKPKKKGKAK